MSRGGSDWTGVVGASEGLKCDGSCESLFCGKMSCGDAGEAVVCRVGVEGGLGMTLLGAGDMLISGSMV